MSEPLMIDSSHIEVDSVVRFVPRDRKRPVLFHVYAVDWHPHGFTVLTGRRCQFTGDELDGYSPLGYGNLLTYGAPAAVELAIPGEEP